MNEDKLNKSFLTTEAKEDINEMLGRNEGSGSSSFTTQLETSEGLTIGKGTDDEESLSANELHDLKNSSGFKICYGNVTLSSGDVSAISGVSGKCQVTQGAKNINISDITLTPNDLYQIIYLNWMFNGSPSGVDVCSNLTGVVARVNENKQINWENPTIFLNTDTVNGGAVVVTCLLLKVDE